MTPTQGGLTRFQTSPELVADKQTNKQTNSTGTELYSTERYRETNVFQPEVDLSNL